MRMMLKVTMPTEEGNRAIQDGSLPRVIEATMNRLKPEAAYFLANEGLRSAMIFFNMEDSSDIPTIAEPFFMTLNAEVEFLPVMNGDDLKRGLAAVMEASKR